MAGAHGMHCHPRTAHGALLQAGHASAHRMDVCLGRSKAFIC
jgi:hypothetical protein